jgi:hypothetical protein
MRCIFESMPGRLHAMPGPQFHFFLCSCFQLLQLSYKLFYTKPALYCTNQALQISSIVIFTYVNVSYVYSTYRFIDIAA